MGADFREGRHWWRKSSYSSRPLPLSQKLPETGKQSSGITALHISPQGLTRRLTTLKSSSSVMRRMDETPMRRELRASELRPSGEGRGSVSLASTPLKELGRS